MKETFLLLPLVFYFALCLGQNNNTPDTTDCLVKQINIGTGVDHLSAGNLYSFSQNDSIVKDRYWRLTMLPENSILSTPSCAQILDSTNVAWDTWWDWIDMSTSIESRAISYISRPTDAGIYPYTDEFWAVYQWPPVYIDSPARFTRSFKIVGEGPQAITFSMEGKADDIVFIRVDAEAGVPIFDDADHPNNLRYDSMTNTSATPFTIEKTLMLEPGLHTIDMDLYDAGGICSGLNVKGNISCEDAVIVDNVCFGYTDEETCSIIVDTVISPSDSSTALEGKNREQIKMRLYPNPAQNIIYLESSYVGEFELRIINTMGQLVTTYRAITNGMFEVDLHNLPTGSYFIEFITAKSMVASKINKR